MRLGRAPRLPEFVAAGETVMEAIALDVELGGTPILKQVSLSIRAGEVVALVGPNGAGKTTLFAALSGDIRPAGGEVKLHGLPLPHWSMVERAQRRAVLPQQLALSFPFLVRDVVQMARAPWAGTPRRQTDASTTSHSLQAAEVDHLSHRRFTSLSGGERARVAFARVLAQECQLILLDEPTAALDIHHQEVLLGIVRERARFGAAVLVVIHDLSLAAAYADRIALLSDGQIVGDGPPSEVFTETNLSAVYGHTIQVHSHPISGELLVVPERSGRQYSASTSGAPEPRR